MKEVSAIDDWNTLNQVAVLGYQDAILLRGMQDLIERWRDPNCRGPIEQAGAGRAAQLIIDGLLFRMHIFVTRAFGLVKHKDDRHLRAAVGFLRRQPDLDSLQSPQNSTRLRTAISAFDAAAAHGRLDRLTKMRNKQLAHMASYDGADRPTINDLFEMTKVVSDIWENLAIGTGTISIEVETQLLAYRRSADRFWSKFDGVRFMTDDDERFDLV